VACSRVGPEFEREFLARDPGSAAFFARPHADPQGRAHFDLPGYALHRLRRAGLAPVDAASCTFAGTEDFFSYRRAQARKESDYGRQISAIALT
jgi:copper oxidase (laccase) domain-containing protein